MYVAASWIIMVYGWFAAADESDEIESGSLVSETFSHLNLF